MDAPREKIVVLDFGAQYTKLIARRVRESRVFSVIEPFDIAIEDLKAMQPSGIILSGGPASVDEPGAPMANPEVLELGVPVLGICYGLQWIVHLLGGEVVHAEKREYGKAQLKLRGRSDLFSGVPKTFQVWMSHGDSAERLPPGFKTIGQTHNCKAAAIADEARGIYAVQFHPEVAHTAHGTEIVRNFAQKICGCSSSWSMSSFVETAIEDVRTTVNDGRVICGLSGGVDSSVTAALAQRAIGDRLVCVLVNNGLLRKGEQDMVKDVFENHFETNLHCVDAEQRFLDALAGVIDPEEKRRIVGATFIDVFEEEAAQLGEFRFLAQGTLYPDVIESTSATGGPSATIKTHHNVGGLPERVPFELIEPLRSLFKDEVREVGRELGLPEGLVMRHPFPGPGLAVRVLGEVTKERLDIIREADEIVMEEIRRAGLYDKIWQSFVVLLPVQTVGVMGDGRTYENVAALRAVVSEDAMTADWYRMPYDVLGTISNRIINEVRGINRVVYDISSKPPSTIEWE